MEYVSLRQIEPAKKTFFYEDKNGRVFACQENEASLFGRYHTLIGVSSGEAFRKVLRDAKLFKGDTLPKEEAQKLLQDAFNAELEVARGNFERPQRVEVHFDSSFPEDQRKGFVPPK